MQADSYRVIKGVTRHGDVDSVITLTDEQRHNTLRRSIANAFTAKTTLDYEPHIDGTIEARVTVTNTGARPAVETVQWYLRDLVTSLTWADKELKGYSRVELAPGESKDVGFALPASACTIVDAAAERVVEPGEFELLAGPDSRDRTLLAARFRLAE